MNLCKDFARVLALVFMFGAFPALAESSEGIKNLEGFFVGVDAVYRHAKVGHDVWDNGIIYPNRKTWHDGEQYNAWHRCADLVPSVNVGYSYFCNNWYVGLSADVAFGKKTEGDITLSRANGHSKLGGISYGIKAKGGYYFEDLNSVIYGIAGVKWRNADFRVAMSNPLLRKYETSSTSLKLNNPLFVVGVGIERPIYQKLSFSAEYEYAWRNSKGDALADYANGNLKVGTFAKTKQSLKEHSFKIGLKYHF